MFTSNANTNTTATTNRENTGTKILDIVLSTAITAMAAYIATVIAFFAITAATKQTAPQTTAITGQQAAEERDVDNEVNVGSAELTYTDPNTGRTVFINPDTGEWTTSDEGTESDDGLILVDNGSEGMELIEAGTGKLVISGRTIEQAENKETGEAEYVCLGDAEYTYVDPNTGRALFVNPNTREWTISKGSIETAAVDQQETKEQNAYPDGSVGSAELTIVDPNTGRAAFINEDTGEWTISGDQA